MAMCLSDVPSNIDSACMHVYVHAGHMTSMHAESAKMNGLDKSAGKGLSPLWKNDKELLLLKS